MDDADKSLTTSAGASVADTPNPLTAGPRGPALPQDRRPTRPGLGYPPATGPLAQRVRATGS